MFHVCQYPKLLNNCNNYWAKNIKTGLNIIAKAQNFGFYKQQRHMFVFNKYRIAALNAVYHRSCNDSITYGI